LAVVRELDEANAGFDELAAFRKLPRKITAEQPNLAEVHTTLHVFYFRHSGDEHSGSGLHCKRS
jgi:hypothetical protein